jgi:hypothetical protein
MAVLSIAFYLLTWFVACDSTTSHKAAVDDHHGHDHLDHDHHDHAHESGEHQHDAGPHGGAIADWGRGVYHVEFTVNHQQKQATIYVLTSDAKTPAAIPTEKIQVSIIEPLFDIELTAQPQEGDRNDRSSRFVAQHDNFGIVREFEGTIVGQIDGVPYTGEFRESP